MVSIELEDKEVLAIIQMMEGATLQLREAEKGLVLLNKFKEAANASKE